MIRFCQSIFVFILSSLVGLTMIAPFSEGTANAAPSITSLTSGAPLLHGQTLTIVGQSFGAKIPAAPLMWDDGEDRTVNDQSSVLNKGWVDPWPRRGTSSLEHRIKYRSSGYRNVASPHSRSTKYLGGGHYQTANNNPPYIGAEAEDYMNVMVTADAGSGKSRWYAIFYYREDPEWLSPCPLNNNHKVTVVNAGAAGYTGGMNYIGMRGREASCLSSNPGPRWTYNAIPPACDIGTYPADYPQVSNPKMQWAHLEERIADDYTLGFRDLLVDNIVALKFKNNCPNWFNGQGGDKASGIRSYTVGGYYRWAPDMNDVSTYRGDINNFRYFDDIYIDTTLARVMLANDSAYENATIIEPQIPETWSDGQISLKINLGKLPQNGKAYLFVFDANNDPSEAFCVPIGSGSCGDVIKPTPPTLQ